MTASQPILGYIFQKGGVSLLLGMPLSISCSNLNKKFALGTTVSECSDGNHPLYVTFFTSEGDSP